MDQAVQNPDVSNTKIRGVRVPDDLWEKAQKKAQRRHETVSSVIVRALVEYTEGEPDE